MGKLNLSEAAKSILMNEGSKETFDSNISSKRSGQNGPSKLPTSVVTGQKDVGEVAGVVDKKDDQAGDYTKGTPSATPPGATPPVGAEAGSKLTGQPGQTQGAENEVAQADATDYSSIRDRVKAKLAKQTFHANPGATFQSYAEEIVAEEKEKEEKGHEDEAEDKKMIKSMMKKQKMKEDIEADVSALLSDQDLSEEFKEKAATIFEAAVIARSSALMEEVEEALFEEFESAIEQVKEELSVKLDDYIGYMAEEWVKENALAIEQGLRSEIVEDFMSGLRNLFIEHYIDIPEDKVDVVEELTTKVQELENDINEQIQSAVELRKELNEHKKSEAIHAVCEGLTQTQVEKMKTLAESVDFNTDEEFAEKLVTLRTSYFTESTVKAADKSALFEEVEVEDEKPVVKTNGQNDALINAAANAISKSVAK
jgi:hypothetical protein